MIKSSYLWFRKLTFYFKSRCSIIYGQQCISIGKDKPWLFENYEVWILHKLSQYIYSESKDMSFLDF